MPNKPNAIAPNQEFECIIRANTDTIKNRIEDIFKVSVLLGGLGKRSRRGFGSIKIVKVNGSVFDFDYSPDSIVALLNAVVTNGFKVNGSKIERINIVSSDANYPYIKEIAIGNGCEKYEDLLKIIGKSSHENVCDHTGFVDTRNKKRFSSPIIVSVIEAYEVYKSIITSLNPVFENANYPRERNGCKKTSCSRSARFISDILKGCK